MATTKTVSPTPRKYLLRRTPTSNVQEIIERKSPSSSPIAIKGKILDILTCELIFDPGNDCGCRYRNALFYSQSYSKPIMTVYHDAFNDDILGKSAGTTGCNASGAIG